MELFDHQRTALKLMEGQEAFALLMEQGTGKTRVTIDDACRLHKQGKIDALLIIAPNGVHLNWLPELERWATTNLRMSAWRGDAGKKLWEEYCDLIAPDPKLTVMTMNVEAMATKKGVEYATAFCKAHNTMIVMDESSRIKTPGAKRTKSIIQLGKYSRYRRILTGTPITQSPMDIYSQFQFLDTDIFGFTSFYAFRNRYAIVVERHFSGQKPFKEVTGYRRLDELKERLRGHSYRVLKKDCLDLPEKLYKILPIIMGAKQKRVYNELKETVRLELSMGDVTVAMALTKMLRLQQVIGGFITLDDGTVLPVPESTRIKALMDCLQDVQGKVIIWARFVPEIEAIRDALVAEYGRKSTVCYYGAVSQDDRVEAIDRLQEDDECRFFVGNPHSGGLGITLTAASTTIYYSNDFSLETRLQSEDRNHRIGTVDHVTYIDMEAQDTIDSKIIAALRSKKSLADVVTGDPAGWLS